jgi:hypothetical protein
LCTRVVANSPSRSIVAQLSACGAGQNRETDAPMNGRKVPFLTEYEVRIPARFFKDQTLSLEAKALLPILVAHADHATKQTHIGNKRLQKLFGRQRAVLERALRELCDKGWLKRIRQRLERGRWGPRILVWCIPHTDRCSNSPQRSAPATVKRATSHTPGQVKSPEDRKASFTSAESTGAQNLSNGATECSKGNIDLT